MDLEVANEEERDEGVDGGDADDRGELAGPQRGEVAPPVDGPQVDRTDGAGEGTARRRSPPRVEAQESISSGHR